MSPTTFGWVTFHGDWNLRTGNIDDSNGIFSRFVVRGSQGGDGIYDVNSTWAPIEVVVTGAEWQVQLERFSYGIAGWWVAAARRITSFDASHGLQVDLDSRIPHSHGAAGHIPGMRLRCRLDDPRTRTPDPGDPFDFTLPRTGVE